MAFENSNKNSSQSVLSTCFAMWFAIWFAVAQALFGVTPAFAQQTNAVIDLDPPLIEHEIIPEVESSTRQTFVATVVDDDELESVRLFYRFSGEPTYSSALMNRVSFSSSYIAQINTDPGTETAIEYYIQARDKSGNRTVRGYAFNPLMRSITVENDKLGSTANVATKDAAAPQAKPRKALYIVIGVLAVGLLASLAGGSSGGGGNSCDASGCKLDINIDVPVVTNE